MHDLKAICDALATRYAAITTPTGAVAMRKAYGQIPKNIAAVPCVVIEPRDGDILVEGQSTFTHHIDVNFYLSKRPGDTARVEAQRQIWLVPLLVVILTSGSTIGLAASNVKSALPMTYEFTELPFGADSYDAIAIHFDVIVRETFTVIP